MEFYTAISAGCQSRFAAARKENAMGNDCRMELINFENLLGAAPGGASAFPAVAQMEGLYGAKENGETAGASPLCGGACLCRDGEHGAPADKRERRSRPPERGRKAEKRQERISEVTGKEKGNGANGWTDRAE